MNEGKINKMLSLLSLLNVYKTSTAVIQTTEMKSSFAAVEEENAQTRETDKVRTYPVSAFLLSRA